MRGEFIDVGGRRLYYYAAGSRGSGDPILLIHGFPTSGHLWGELVPLLPDGHRVVVLDLLGYGRSDPAGSADLTFLGHAARVLALMDELGIAKAVVVGHHMGGGIAQALAVTFPERVSALALLHSVGFDAVLAGRLAAARAFFGLTRLLPASLSLRLLRQELCRWYDDSYRGAHSVDQYLRPFRGPGYRGLVRHFAALEPTQSVALAGQLPALRIPVGIVAGGRDTAMPVSVARRLHAAIPNSTLDFEEDARHFSPEEAPGWIANVLEGLVRR